jgi:hypothetical protein
MNSVPCDIDLRSLLERRNGDSVAVFWREDELGIEVWLGSWGLK